MASKTKPPKTTPAKSYKHPESESPMRPEVGTQAQFKKKLPPKKYRFNWRRRTCLKSKVKIRIANLMTIRLKMDFAATALAVAEQTIGEQMDGTPLEDGTITRSRR